ncbi:hypothetical protein ACFQDE_01915 [Deinococcus caeni]|uniref:hypothetical protein n=1 Tax=Deinococcus caeni TaxID=569127 RepID=UPI00361462E1
MTYPGARLNLLVVDDEEQILELLDLTLTMQGFTYSRPRTVRPRWISWPVTPWT